MLPKDLQASPRSLKTAAQQTSAMALQQCLRNLSNQNYIHAQEKCRVYTVYTDRMSMNVMKQVFKALNNNTFFNVHVRLCRIFLCACLRTPFSNANQPRPQSNFQLAEPFRAPASVLPSSIALDRSSMASSSRPQPYTEHGPSNAHCLVQFRSNPNTKSLHVGKALPKIHVLPDTMFTLLYMFTTKTHAACAKPRALFLANVVGHSEDGTHPMINTTVVVVSDQGGFDCQARTNKRIWRLSIHFGLTLLVD